jgi:TonB-linked SusC/RagA family outer membrane protein
MESLLNNEIMRFFYKKYVNPRLVVTLVCLFISGTLTANIKSPEAADPVKITVNLVDDSGNPIPNAKVMVGKNVVEAVSLETGVYSFDVSPDDIVTLTAPGFERNVLSGRDLINNNVISLGRAELFNTADGDIPLPYTTVKKRHATGSYDVIKGEDLMSYPSTDLRLSLIGQVPGLHITEHHGAPGTHPAEQRGLYGASKRVSISARGRDMMYVIDGIPAHISEISLDPGEIESITVVKDIVGKAMYGPLGADGIILIETKRGSFEEPFVSVNFETGTSVIDRFPEWVSGADYARLNNQAREADGIAPLYTSSDIAGYERNDPYDFKYPSTNFADFMTTNTRAFHRANVSAGGGGETAKYFLYLGYNREGDIFGIGSTADYNRINMRSNIDIAINKFISTELGINGNLGIRRSPAYGYAINEGNALMGINEFDVALPDILMTPPVEFPVYANNDPELSQPWYGISSRYANPIGNLLGSGDYQEQNRQAGVKLTLKYDLSQIATGLKSRTAFGFDALNLSRIGQANRYEGYNVVVSDTDTTMTRLQTGISDDTRRKLHDYHYIRMAFSQSLNYERKFDQHNIQTGLTYFLYRKVTDNIRNPEPQMLGVWTGKYTYNDKYTLQGVLNYAHTFSFLKENRGEVFPSVGAGWVISEESFLTDTKFLSFLKLRAEIGVIGYDPYLDPHIVRTRFRGTTRSSFGPYPLNRWFGTNVETNPPSTYPEWVGNSDLGWEKRKEFNIGLDGLMFDSRLSVEVNYFNTMRDGIISRLTNSLPDVTGMSGALPYFNHNQYRYYGIETGLQWTETKGKLEFSVGGNATFQNSKIERYDEPNYRDDYQSRLDQPIDTYWGLNYLGTFASDAEALATPQLFDAELHAGDLRYEDKNSDGVVDENDYAAIGNTTPRVFYSLNANIKFSNFQLSVIGTGAASFDIPMTSPYFQNGWGDNNYSAFVRDNIGGAYPRLTYERVNNNFRESSFWLTKGDYFKVKFAELAYTIPPSTLKMIKSKGARIFVRGTNLLTISSVKEIDPESPTSGIMSYPLYKTFTAGISLPF